MKQITLATDRRARLVGQLQTLFATEFDETLSEFRAASAEQNSLDELRHLFLASFEFVEKNPVLLLFSSDEEGLLSAYQGEFTKRNKRWRTRIRQALKQGIDRGEIRDLDVTQVSVVFHELQTAMVANVKFTGAAPRYDRKKIALAIDIFLTGIGQVESPAAGPSSVVS